tara:strand:+ start:147 stop:842 length:696 start_codon:yes stop_codon:yes gene_type:complete
MNAFKHIFLDLDRTLWDFESNSQLELTNLYHKYKLHEKGISLVDEFINVYKKINEECWLLYRENKLSKEHLRTVRFAQTLEYFGIIDDSISSKIGWDYVKNSPLRTLLLDGCLELLEYLHSKYILHIITNGFEEVQFKKLSNSNLLKYFDQIITSEAVGCKKPHPEIFNYALSQSGAELTNSVMIGDDLNTDVQGAINIGMSCIFYNPNKTETILPLLADVSHLLEIKDVL